MDEIEEVAALLAEAEIGTPEVKEEKVIEEAVTEEVATEEVEEVEEVEGEEETAAEDGKEETKEVEPLPDEPYTIKSLAKAIEIEPAELYEVIVPMGDHGDPLSIGKLKDSYTKLLTKDKESENTIAEQQKTIEASKSGMTQSQQISGDEYKAQVEMALVQKEYADTDWKDLEEYDPGKAALMKQNFNERYNQAQGVMNQAQAQRQTEEQGRINDSYTALIGMNPEWKDDSVRKEALSEIRTELISAGYSAESVDTAYDPIAITLMKELVTLRKEKVAGVKALTKVKTAPKVIKSSAVKAKTTKTRSDELLSKAKKSGNDEDVIAAVAALLP